METTTLGRTGLSVSVAGLGSGGPSRIGKRARIGDDASADLVRAALDMGVNFIDTASAYGTEDVVGRGIAGRREEVVLSTKVQIGEDGEPPRSTKLASAAVIAERVDECLARLKTDYVDILHLHGVEPPQYEHCRDEQLPALKRLQEAGKIRFVGLTERFMFDTGHKVLKRAIEEDDCWDVVMAGYSLLNPSARSRVFVPAQARDVGVLVMYAVRRVLSQPDRLENMIAHMIEEKLLDADKIDRADPLGFVLADGGAQSLVDAAYRFCRHAPGVHVTLTGTGSLDHLKENIASLERGPLSDESLARLEDLFGHIHTISGN